VPLFDHRAVTAFWFSDAARPFWFESDAAFDARVTELFGRVLPEAAAGRLADWEATPDGAVALVLVLDQAPRNMFRGDPRAFATDPLARAVALRAMARGFEQALTPEQRHFLYLPFMHSEDLDDQERCVRLNETLERPDILFHAKAHRDIIARFGRFPHRNAALTRASTAEEAAFLEAGSPY
jgi:uncharacterized protein (DUF924 family)